MIKFEGMELEFVGARKDRTAKKAENPTVEAGVYKTTKTVVTLRSTPWQ